MGSKVVLKAAYPLLPLQVEPMKFKKEAIHKFCDRFCMMLYTSVGIYQWDVRAGYLSNCGSIPWIGQKVLRVKSFDPKNTLQNAFFFLHDDLYQKKGYDIFNRDDGDALCRGGLREAGCSRYQASTIDFFLKIGAWGHWGDNAYGNPDALSSLVKVG